MSLRLLSWSIALNAVLLLGLVCVRHSSDTIIMDTFMSAKNVQEIRDSLGTPVAESQEDGMRVLRYDRNSRIWFFFVNAEGRVFNVKWTATL